MRVIAGRAKGRRLRTVRGYAVRPTADRTKEALFSIVESRFALVDARVLDLFAGSGALGIEALSRGAARAVFVEQDAAAVRVLRANVELCDFAERARVLPMTVRRALLDLEDQGERFDVAFVDPPYRSGLLAETLHILGTTALLSVNAWVVAERSSEEVPGERYGPLRLTRTRRYGKTSVDLYCLANEVGDSGQRTE